MSAPDLDAVVRRVVLAVRSAPSVEAALPVVRHYVRDAYALREALVYLAAHPAPVGARVSLPLADDDDEPSAGDVAEALAGGR